VFILNGNFPDDFPQDEDPVPADGVPHPMDGHVQHGNEDAGRQHDLNGAGHHVHVDFGINDQQMDDVQQELQARQPHDQELQDWDAWPKENQAENVGLDVVQDPVDAGAEGAGDDIVVQHKEISFDQ
jgi:hypothetical protein